MSQPALPTTPEPPVPSPARDRATLASGMTISALLISLAINKRDGLYDPIALAWLTGGYVACLLAVVVHTGAAIETWLRQSLTSILLATAAIQSGLLLYSVRGDPEIAFIVFVIITLGLAQATNLRSMRVPLVLAMVVAFCLTAMLVFTSRAPDPHIDVFDFQQDGALALANGHDPYAIRFHNDYTPDTPFYGPGVVDSKNWLTYGFPYPPLSLLLAIPARLYGGDVRYAHVIGMGIAAIIMALARPGRRAPLAAFIFLLIPRVFIVLNMSWTEPLLIFTFSLVMYCACHRKKDLPWALGLFFATKQYTVLAVPAVYLLTEGPRPFKQFFMLCLKAGVVVAFITLPFVFWNFHEFKRAVVDWQLVQPFRTDALSYLVWIYNHNGGVKPPIWTPFLVVIPAIIISLWRCPRTPSGFAAAITFIYVTFFAFNKQAFCNYYYFVVATACWSIAAMPGEPKPLRAPRAAPQSQPAHVPLAAGR